VAEVATGALVYGAATWTLNRATLRDVQQMFRK
jgi:hypothetical protein